MPPDRMLRTWAQCTPFAISLASATTTVLNMLSDHETRIGVAQIRATVSAMYLEFTIKPQAILATGISGEFGLGIAVLNRNATAATVPNVIDADYPWMWTWHAFIHPQAHESSAGNFTFQEVRRVVVIRAQRVIKSGDTLVFTARHGLGSAMNITVAGQILLKS